MRYLVLCSCAPDGEPDPCCEECGGYGEIECSMDGDEQPIELEDATATEEVHASHGS